MGEEQARRLRRQNQPREDAKVLEYLDDRRDDGDDLGEVDGTHLGERFLSSGHRILRFDSLADRLERAFVQVERPGQTVDGFLDVRFRDSPRVASLDSRLPIVNRLLRFEGSE